MSKKSFFNSIFVGVTIFGTLVGAGFASGKEIWFYFARFGGAGFFGAFLMCFLFFFACILCFSFGKKFAISSVQDATSHAFKKLSPVVEIFLVLSNLVMLSSMFAGADSLFGIVMPNLPYRLAGVVSALVCTVVVCFGFGGITKTNALVVPLLLAMILLVLGFSAFDGNIFLLPSSNFGDFEGAGIYGLLFLGSNIFFAGFVFAKMGSKYQKNEIVWGSFLGCVMLALSLLLVLILLFSNQELASSDMPIVAIALKSSFPLSVLVLCVIWLGLLTTSFAMLYTISNWLKTYFGNQIFMTFLTSIIALLMSGIGFSLFVQVVYPILGVFGFVFMLFVFVALKRSNNQLKANQKTKKCKNM